MTVDRSIMGLQSEPRAFVVEPEAIRAFAEAIADPHPAYRSGRIAPPTFPSTFHVPFPGVDVHPSRMLHREEEYEYVRPLRAGDRITVVRRISDVAEKSGTLGRVAYVVCETEGRDAEGALVFRGRTALIVR